MLRKSMEASPSHDESDCGARSTIKHYVAPAGAAQWSTAAVIFRGQPMKASVLYRIASVLLLLFAIPHTLGFRQTIPEWGVGSVIRAMRSIHFDAQGFNR